MSWILLYAALEVSYFLGGGLLADDGDEDPTGTYQVGLEAEVRLLNYRECYLFVGGSLEVPVQPVAWNYWNPLVLDSTTRIGVHLGLLTFGFEHRCAHPLLVWRRVSLTGWELWSERVYIRLETR